MWRDFHFSQKKPYRHPMVGLLGGMGGPGSRGGAGRPPSSCLGLGSSSAGRGWETVLSGLPQPGVLRVQWAWGLSGSALWPPSHGCSVAPRGLA